MRKIKKTVREEGKEHLVRIGIVIVTVNFQTGLIKVHTYFFIRIAAVVTATISSTPPATLPPIIQASRVLLIDPTKKTRQLLPILNTESSGSLITYPGSLSTLAKRLLHCKHANRQPSYRLMQIQGILCSEQGLPIHTA